MEKLPEDTNPTPPADQPNLVRPSNARIWFMAIMFFMPLLFMILFAIFFFTLGFGDR